MSYISVLKGGYKKYMLLFCALSVVLFCENSDSSTSSSNLFFSPTLNNGQLNITTLIPNHVYPNAGIKINTPGYSLKYIGTECRASSNGYCIFSVSDTTPAFLTVTGPSGNMSITLCLNGLGSLSCQRYDNFPIPPSPQFAYIVDSIDSKVSICTLTNGSTSLNHCHDTGLNSVEYPSFSYPQGVTLNHAGTHAYVTTYNNVNAWECNVNSNNHTFESCVPFTVSSPSTFPGYGMIAINNAGTVAYLADSSGNNVLACPIALDGTFSSTTCISSGATTLDNPIGITLNKANTTAYIANSQSSVSVCTVNGNSFTNCINKTSSMETQTSDVALNSDETILYIASNYDPTVYACSTQGSGPSFAFCKVANGLNVFTGSYGIRLNAAGTIAYITDGSSTTYICPIKPDFTFDTCTASTLVAFPTGIALS